jgi:hypothetical protein
MSTHLPVVLESLRIASPCGADWDDMRGDERVRFCGRCEKNVYNLSAMSRAEAEAVVREKEGRLCVRFYQRSDGTVLTEDCPVGVRRRRLRQRVWSAVSGLAASLALAFGLAGRARADLTIRDGKHPAPPKPPVTVMHGGAVAIHNPPPAPPKPPARMGEPMPLMGDVAAPTPR